MEGLYLQFVPGPGLLAAGILLLAVLAAGIVAVWREEERRHTAEEREPLKKAA